MIVFAAEDQANTAPAPTPLYGAVSAASEANAWSAINGFSIVETSSAGDEDYKAATMSAAITDLGCLVRYSITGADAARALRRLTTIQCERIEIGDNASGLILTDKAKVIDLCNVARLATQMFMLTTPASHARWLSLATRSFDVGVSDISNEIAAIGLIGPKAHEAFEKVIGRKSLNSDDPMRTVRGVETAFRSIQIGSVDGYELVFPKDEALTIWERFVRRAAVSPIGLNALEALRIEAGAPRTNVDFFRADRASASQARTPWELGLSHLAPLDCGSFNGRQTLRKTGDGNRRLATLAVDADALSPGYVVKGAGKEYGSITSCAWSPALKRVVAFADLDKAAFGKVRELSVCSPAGDVFSAHYYSTPESAREQATYSQAKRR